MVVVFLTMPLSLYVLADSVNMGFRTGTNFGAYSYDGCVIFTWAREDRSLGVLDIEITGTTVKDLYSKGINQFTSDYPTVSVSDNIAIISYPDEENKLRFSFYKVLSNGKLKYLGKQITSERAVGGISSTALDDLLFISISGENREPSVLCYEVYRDRVELKTQEVLLGEACVTEPRLAVMDDYLYVTWVDPRGAIHIRAFQIKSGGASLIDKGERSLMLYTETEGVENIAPSDVVSDGEMLFLSWRDTRDDYLHIRSFNPSGSSLGNYIDETIVRESLSKYRILNLNGELWVFWVADGGNMGKKFNPSYPVYATKIE